MPDLESFIVDPVKVDRPKVNYQKKRETKGQKKRGGQSSSEDEIISKTGTRTRRVDCSSEIKLGLQASTEVY